MAIICRSGRGRKVVLLCMHRSNRSFPCPTFFGNQCTSIQLSQPLIGFILPFAIWCSSSSFCLLHDYECMLPISRWNAVHYNIALCESQNCSRSETIPLLQIKFLSSSILLFIWDLMWVKYHPVLFLLIMAGSYFRVRFLLGSGSHRLNRAWRWLGKRADTKKSTDFPLVGNLADPSFIHFGGCCVDPVENIAKKGIYWNQASKNSQYV